TVGTYDVTLIATNATGSDDEIKTGYITVSEIENMALQFDGIDEYVDLGTNVINPGNIFTIEAWILSNQLDANWHGFLGNADGASNGDRSPGLWIYNDTGLHYGFGDGTNWNNADAPDVITPGVWNHIAWTFDGTTSKIFVNGEEKQSHTTFSGKTPINPIRYIGKVDLQFKGYIDEVRIWNDVRTPTEIVDNQYTLADPASETNLLTYYQFDKMSGAVLPVIKGADDGTLISMEDEDWVVADYYLYPQSPTIPANVVTSISGTDLVIDWDDSANATGYDVYSSDDPYGAFAFVTSVVASTYTVAADQSKLFYYIIAVDNSKITTTKINTKLNNEVR
ncbi:MAG: hypothetical protein GQ534_12135, partial [Candidatus Delongbacteria bacterium]|nr:hypothetical protein [Candidatus Delongbacteria bacterium]